jgi:dnd system-associated protein 4
MAQSKWFPRDLALEVGDRHSKVTKLVEDKLSPFYKKTMKEVFMYAMGIGFKKGKRLPLKKKTGAIPLRTFSPAEISLIKSAAIAEKKSVDVLFGENIKEAFEIAEEYANGGIDLLFYGVFGDEPGDPDKKMEQYLRDILSESQTFQAVSEPSLASSSELLKDFENELRSFIQISMEETVGKNWWKQAVPPDVQEKCKERKENREQLPWMDKEDYPLICYADFADYFKIITKRDNWRKIFAKYFADEAWIKTKLVLELTPIRNNIAHNRELTPESAQKFTLATQEILRCIRKETAAA